MGSRFRDDGDIAEFFGRLYAALDGWYLEVRAIDLADRVDGKRSVSEWFSIKEGAKAFRQAQAFASRLNADGYDVFFGVLPRCRGGTEDGDVVSGCALWCDIDGLATIEEAEARLDAALFPLAPDAAVFSGGGIHLYWVLKEPVDPASPDWSIYLRSLRAMTKLHGGDPVCTNPSRILRFPLSLSHKRGLQTQLWMRP
jgi:hypothetical protein